VNHYSVASPPYQVPKHTTVWDIDPPEITCSYWQGLAESKRDAKLKAVREWRAHGDMQYCEDGEHPFARLEVIDWTDYGNDKD